MADFSNIDSLKRLLDAAEQELTKARKAWSDSDALAREYDRQSVAHAANGNYQDSQIAAQRRDSEMKNTASLKVTLDSRQKDYDAALSAYNTALNSLTPEQKADIKVQQDAVAAAPGLQKAALTQTTTKYIIYGTIALVVLIGVIILIRKKLKA